MAISANFEFKPYYCILVGYKELAGATRLSTYNLNIVSSNPADLTISF
jgi:hypothetical protein